MASAGGDGFWSVVGKTSTGSADDLLSLGRGGGGGGGGGGGNAGYAEDVGFLVTCPKLRNIRNTVLEAQRILKHFSCVQEKKKVETETEPPQEKERGGDENGFLWVAAKLEHLVRCNAKVLVHPRSGAANATGVLSRILAKTAEAKERGPVKKKRKKKRKRPQQAEDALEDPGSTPVGDKDDGGEGAQAAEEDPLDVICSARYCQRFFPIQALCKFEAASLEAGLGAASASFLRGDVAEGRKLPAKSPLKFAVWCKQRKLKVGEEGRRVVDLLAEVFKAHCEGAGIEAQVSLRDPQVLVLAEAPFEASGGQKLIALCVLPSGCVDIKPKGVMVKTLFDKADL